MGTPKIAVTAPDGAKLERNDKVVVVKDGEEKEIKFKKLDDALIEGWQVKTESKRG
jgi:hypothetical protein